MSSVFEASSATAKSAAATATIPTTSQTAVKFTLMRPVGISKTTRAKTKCGSLSLDANADAFNRRVTRLAEWPRESLSDPFLIDGAAAKHIFTRRHARQHRRPMSLCQAHRPRFRAARVGKSENAARQLAFSRIATPIDRRWQDLG